MKEIEYWIYVGVLSVENEQEWERNNNREFYDTKLKVKRKKQREITQEKKQRSNKNNKWVNALVKLINKNKWMWEIK